MRFWPVEIIPETCLAEGLFLTLHLENERRAVIISRFVRLIGQKNVTNKVKMMKRIVFWSIYQWTQGAGPE